MDRNELSNELLKLAKSLMAEETEDAPAEEEKESKKSKECAEDEDETEEVEAKKSKVAGIEALRVFQMVAGPFEGGVVLIPKKYLVKDGKAVRPVSFTCRLSAMSSKVFPMNLTGQLAAIMPPAPQVGNAFMEEEVEL